MRLQRRSYNGYMSASGMFEVAYPWATRLEGKAKKEYLKSLDPALEEEVAAISSSTG